MNGLATNLSLGSILYNQLKNANQNSVAIINSDTEEETTFGKLFLFSRKLAKIFINLKLQKNNVILVEIPNSWLQMTIGLACLYTNIKWAILVDDSTKRDREGTVSWDKPDLIICHKFNLDAYLNLKQKYNFIKHIVTTEFVEPKILNLNTLFQEIDDDSAFVMTADNNDENIILLAKTSGTTGAPKAIGITQGNLKHGMRRLFDKRFENFNAEDILYIDVYRDLISVQNGFGAILGNCKQIILTKMSNKKALEAIAKYKVNKFMVMPYFVIFLATTALADFFDLSSIKEIIVTGSTLNKKITLTLKKRFNIPYIREGYGSTESSTMVFLTPRIHKKINTVGVVTLDEIVVRVVDVKTRKILGPNQIGELLIFYKGIINGYLDNADATEELFENNFLKTGDLVYYDEDNFFYVVDRIKNVIKYLSDSIAPCEIEQCILEHPDVEDVAVIGIPDEKCNELAVAFIVKRAESVIKEEDILRWYNPSVSSYKQLHGGVRFIDKIPKTERGKASKRLLLNIL